MHYTLCFICALALSALLTPLVKVLAARAGAVVPPRADRWHSRPTPVLGGIALWAGFVAVTAVLLPGRDGTLPLLVCGTLIFLIGLVDDLRGLSPQVKFTGQIAVTALLIGLGTVIEIVPWPVLAVPLTFFWVVGLTNAFNLIDNMDGLSAGIAAISAAALFVFSLPAGEETVAVASLALAGACVGFLFYNFNPARIFMGDCGSMFLGFTLAALSVTGTWRHASSLFVTLLLPVLILAIPIFDTAFVSVTRTLRGQPISRGGRDHISHRLVALGFSERRTVVILYVLAAVLALATLFFGRISPLAFLVVVVVFLVGFFYFGTYLGLAASRSPETAGLQVSPAWKANALVVNLQRLIEICIDLVLVVAAYFASYLIRFEGGVPELQMTYFIKTLPVVVGVKIGVFYYFGLYRTIWRHVSVRDFINILKSVFVSSLVIVALILMYSRFTYFSRTVFIIDGMLCLLLVGGAHFSLRIMREYLESQPRSGRTVLIAGAGDAGEQALREIRNNPEMKFRVVGFLDDDPFKQQRRIHDVRVLGPISAIDKVARRTGAAEVLIAISSLPPERLQEISAVCDRNNIACRRFAGSRC